MMTRSVLSSDKKEVQSIKSIIVMLHMHFMIKEIIGAREQFAHLKESYYSIRFTKFIVFVRIIIKWIIFNANV